MQTKAIIIKKQNTNEYDQWVTCYTEEFGKLKTVAKSILKPSSVQALHLDIFNLAEFELINGRGMPIVTGAQVINPFGGIKSSLAKTAVTYFFAEAVDKMVFENDKDEKLWSFLISFLDKLNKIPCGGCPSTFREGQTRLLDILGYLPEVNSCKVCDEKLDEGNFGAFNHVLGGVVCKRCFLSGHGGILIGNEDFELLNIRNIGNGQFRQVKRSNTLNNSIKRSGLTFQRSVLDGMFEYIAGGKFSSLELLNVLR